MQSLHRALLATTLFAVSTSAPAQGQDQLTKYLDQYATPVADEWSARVSMSDQAEYLAGLSAIHPSEVEIINSELFAYAFGASYKTGATALMSFEADPTTVYGVHSKGSLGSVQFQDLELWSIDLTNHPAASGMPAGAFEAYSFTASVGASGSYIGLMTSVDPRAFGYSGPETGRVNTFIVQSTLDTTIVDPLLAGAFVAQSINGGLDDFQGIASWIEAITGSEGWDDYSGDGDDGFMVGDPVAECIKQAVEDLNEKLESAWLDYRSAVAPHEKTLGYGSAWDEILIGGGAGTGGFVGGPLSGAVTVVLGAAGGLATWWWNGPTDEEIAEAKKLIEHEKKKLKEARCKAIREFRDQLTDCLQELGYEIDGLDDWVTKQGC